MSIAEILIPIITSTDSADVMVVLTMLSSSLLGVFSVIAKVFDLEKIDNAIKKLEDDPTKVKKFLTKAVSIINLLGLTKKVKR